MLQAAMSTEACPPFPSRDVAQASRKSITPSERKKLRKAGPPMAYDMQSSKQRGRSSSIGEVFSRILPSHRPEKGHTVRTSSETQNTEATQGSEGNPLNSQNERKKSNFELIYGHVRSRSRSKTWPAGNRNEYQAPQQEKKSAMKRILGSIRSPTSIIKSSSEKNQAKLAAAVAAEYYAEKEITKAQQIYEEKEVVTSQQIYEEKRARREQRRSLRESGDFLGVQGANPRTGTWDINGSTSSEPSEMSEEIRRLLAKGRELADKRRQYEEAHRLQQIELQRVQALRDEKKKARTEKRERELRLRRRGKWQLSDNGWKSVVEPDLSPIAQSLEGTPTPKSEPVSLAETPTPKAEPRNLYRLFPMPPKAEPSMPRREPVGATNRQQVTHSGSTDTVVHNIPRSFLDQKRATATLYRSASMSLVQIPRLLDQSLVRKRISSLNALPPVSFKAPIAARVPLSYQSPNICFPVWPSPMIHQTQPDKQQSSISMPTITTIGCGPPLSLLSQSDGANDIMSVAQAKAPAPQHRLNQIALRNDSLLGELWREMQNQQSLTPRVDIMSVAKAPILLLKESPRGTQTPKSPTPRDNDIMSAAQAKASIPQLNKVTMRNTSVLKESLGEKTHTPKSPTRGIAISQKQQSPIPRAPDIAISSDRQLTATKNRSAGLCRWASAGGEKVGMRNIPTSTSTSPRSLQQQEAARRAARIAGRRIADNVRARLMEKMTENASRKTAGEAKVARIAASGAGSANGAMPFFIMFVFLLFLLFGKAIMVGVFIYNLLS
ncbi:uncharacterized protein PAC_12350 [Phialocephala subalpina]|uniref:Uncharacterized protein n=1 Tax=Phialocephala subalpina TaxID=576137 RepID=A0A1L7XBQ1_9HELO|nr:uncharacterized protein PAC_12350 [Phialocephala subalpina]